MSEIDDDKVTSEVGSPPKGGSLPARSKKKRKSKGAGTVIDEWKERNKEELARQRMQSEQQDFKEKAWQSEKVELLSKLKESESKISLLEAAHLPIPTRNYSFLFYTISLLFLFSLLVSFFFLFSLFLPFLFFFVSFLLFAY